MFAYSDHYKAVLHPSRENFDKAAASYRQAIDAGSKPAHKVRQLLLLAQLGLDMAEHQLKIQTDGEAGALAEAQRAREFYDMQAQAALDEISHLSGDVGAEKFIEEDLRDTRLLLKFLKFKKILASRSESRTKGATPVKVMPGLEFYTDRVLPADKPLVAVFDLHGTLIETTWQYEYAYTLHTLLKDKDPSWTLDRAGEWIDQNSEKDLNSLIPTTEEFSKNGITADGFQVELARQQVYLRSVYFPKEMKRAREFVEALTALGVTIYVVTGSLRDVALTQLHEAGFKIPSDHVIGRVSTDRDPNLFSKNKVIAEIQEKHAGASLLHFSDSASGFESVKQAQGFNFGIRYGNTERAERVNKTKLQDAGMDFYVTQPWDSVESILEWMAKRSETGKAKVRAIEFQNRADDIDNYIKALESDSLSDVIYFGDKHGVSADLEQILIKAKAASAAGIKLEIVGQGDVFGKGGNNRRIWKILRDLKELPGIDLKIVYGNHEVGMLQAFLFGDTRLTDSWMKFGGGNEMQDELGGAEQMRELSQWILENYDFYHTDSRGLGHVHAGIPFKDGSIDLDMVQSVQSRLEKLKVAATSINYFNNPANQREALTLFDDANALYFLWPHEWLLQLMDDTKDPSRLAAALKDVVIDRVPERPSEFKPM